MGDSNVKEQIASKWDIWSLEYDDQYAHGIKSEKEQNQWEIFLYETVGKNTVLDEPKKILDVGTGTGFLALILAKLGNECKGIDISTGMLKRAREKADLLELDNVKFEIGDAENINEKDNTYDVVINRHLLWTLPNPQKALNEWIRVLKPGGKLIIIDGDWFYNSKLNKIKIFLGKLLLCITEFKNPWKNKGSYEDDLIAKLPMMKDKNARDAANFVKRLNLEDVEVKGMENVEIVEKSEMPLTQKLINPYKRIIIKGKKPLKHNL